MVITEVRIKLMEDNNERLQAFCSVTFDDAFVVRDLKIIEGHQRLVRGHAQPQADRPLPRLRLQEPSAGALLQPVRRQARRGPGHPRRRRPGQAARRHRPPDQLGLPRSDPERRAASRTRKKRNGPSSPATSAATTTTTPAISTTPTRRWSARWPATAATSGPTDRTAIAARTTPSRLPRGKINAPTTSAREFFRGMRDEG